MTDKTPEEAYQAHWAKVEAMAELLRPTMGRGEFKVAISQRETTLIGHGTTHSGVEVVYTTPCTTSYMNGYIHPKDVSKLPLACKAREFLLNTGCSLSSLTYRIVDRREVKGIDIPSYHPCTV